MRPFGATNKPGTCLWCGRRLRWVCSTEWEVAKELRPRRCLVAIGVYRDGTCGSTTIEGDAEHGWHCEHGHSVPYRRRIKSRTRRHDGPGAYGDGFFCNLDCARRFGLTFARAGRRLVPSD